MAGRPIASPTVSSLVQPIETRSIARKTIRPVIEREHAHQLHNHTKTAGNGERGMARAIDAVHLEESPSVSEDDFRRMIEVSALAHASEFTAEECAVVADVVARLPAPSEYSMVIVGGAGAAH